MSKMLYYYKEQQQELLQILQSNKSWLETYKYNKDLPQVKRILAQNIERYKLLKEANSFIKNYKVKERVNTPINRIVNTNEDEYDNYSETIQREEQVRDYERNYILN